jgi:hypothetical protein
MNLNDLIRWSVGVIIAWSAIAHIDEIHRSILKAQSVLLYESRTKTWGSPNFLR